MGSVVGVSFGWHLWRRRQANFPRDDMRPGFEYLICDQPTTSAASRVTTTVAKVQQFMDFRDVTSLDDAYRTARREFGRDFDMTRDEWRDNPYNEPIEPGWSGVFGMWMFVAQSIQSVPGNWSFANCFCGWKQIEEATTAD